eukprot:3630036-Prymnesium_polylepis.1
MSYLEIYNENVQDLLSGCEPATPGGGHRRASVATHCLAASRTRAGGRVSASTRRRVARCSCRTCSKRRSPTGARSTAVPRSLARSPDRTWGPRRPATATPTSFGRLDRGCACADPFSAAGKRLRPCWSRVTSGSTSGRRCTTTGALARTLSSGSPSRALPAKRARAAMSRAARWRARSRRSSTLSIWRGRSAARHTCARGVRASEQRARVRAGTSTRACLC